MPNLCFKAESDLPYNETVTHYEEVASVVAFDPRDPSHHPGHSLRVAVS